MKRAAREPAQIAQQMLPQHGVDAARPQLRLHLVRPRPRPRRLELGGVVLDERAHPLLRRPDAIERDRRHRHVVREPLSVARREAMADVVEEGGQRHDREPTW